ncbi:MAG: VPLPA-CTERM-specific exosortase XrtD [Nitrospiraceae bacterium]
MIESLQRRLGFGVELFAATLSVSLAAVLCWDGVAEMVRFWLNREEYSHGVLIPLIALYLIWQKRFELSELRFPGSWLGFLLILAGMFLYFAGELSALYVIVQYGFLVLIYGLFLSLMGWRPFLVIVVPLLVLSFMIPLPAFLYNNLSAKLQLLSSEIGVAVIRLFGISVYLEGNVIDLGTYKLQVVEACNGLRYLFPLMTLGFIVAYLYKAEFWKRAIIFLSTIPITVLMNSFRIGVIGVMVNRWGQSMAEGFLHDFEGWVIFMACFAVLFVEMWLLMRITGDRRPLNAVFGLDAPAPRSESQSSAPPLTRTLPAPFIASTVVIALALISTVALPERKEIAPERRTFADFPLALGDWKGQTEVMEQVYIDALKFTEYALVNYKNDQGDYMNFYAAYYDSQRKGQSVHSPRSCLPGGGWEIESLTQVSLPEAPVNGAPLRVNRVVISYGDQKQLVYYWFQQRGRSITNEYLVKWFIFWDAITRNRTDGSLVRLTIPLPPGGDVAQLDTALADFASRVSPVLSEYIPN